MEAWGLGTFMVMACIGTAVLWHPESPIEHWIGDNPLLQRLLMGVAMGLTAIGIVYSPWGKRSGAHINPALTLTFLRLGKIHFWDAVFYVIFQFLAFVAEMLISAGIMGTVLFATNQPKLMNVTGILIGCLLVLYITFEAPFSGMSMNPARTVGSAVVANVWTDWWVYFLAPAIGMLAAAEVYLWTKGKDAVHCAKLNHTTDVRCIFKCGMHAMMENQQEMQKEQ